VQIFVMAYKQRSWTMTLGKKIHDKLKGVLDL